MCFSVYFHNRAMWVYLWVDFLITLLFTTLFFSSLPAPEIAVNYWKLSNKALMRDVILAIRHSFPLFHLSLQSYLVILVFMFMLRADEAHHRVVNHTLGDMDLKQPNPFRLSHEGEGHFKASK